MLGLPKAGVYQLRIEPRSGYEPYLNASTIPSSDTEGLKPIETTIEVPRGVIITGRLIDSGNRPARPPPSMSPTSSCRRTRTTGIPARAIAAPSTPRSSMTVPPGEGFIYANVRGRETPYTRARLRKEDKGKGIGGTGDGETSTIMLNAYNAYKIIDVPADARGFQGGPRHDPRPDAQGPAWSTPTASR